MYNFTFISLYICNNIHVALLTNTIIFSSSLISCMHNSTYRPGFIQSKIKLNMIGISNTILITIHKLCTSHMYQHFNHAFNLSNIALVFSISKIHCICTKCISGKEPIKSLNVFAIRLKLNCWGSGMSSLQDFRYWFFSFSP